MRLVQYNVRRLTADDGSSAVDAVARVLRSLAPTIVTLNEVDMLKAPGALHELARAIGAEHVHFFGHVRGTYGNALISRFPILETEDVHVEGGTELEWPKGSGEMKRIARGMLSATLEVPLGQPAGSRRLTVFVTHLDHIDEHQRVVQMRHVLREMGKLGDAPHALVGDLNALCAEDYSEAEWSAIRGKAAEHGWVPPADAECIRLLQAEGYVDMFRAAEGTHGILGDAKQAKFTAHVGRPMYRIDYAFLSKGAVGSGCRVSGAFVDSSAEGSDHYPLVVDLTWGDDGNDGPHPGPQTRPLTTGGTARL